MSLYSSSTSWGGNCANTNQSPINLSQSAAKPCDLLCDLVFDDAYIPQANLVISDEGMVLQNTAGLGSCKFNGEGYTCTAVLITHPSHHTIENIQADGEVIAIFGNPTGKMLCVSSLFRVNPHQTDSTHFFNAFVPFGNPSSNVYTPVSLGNNWGLFMMVPPQGSYYVYEGSMVVPSCQPCQWVVFKSMINIDGNDFALLVKNVAAGSRPIQSIGDRQIYYNDTEQLAGGPMPHDNKAYMRCKRVAKKGEDVKPVTKAPLGSSKKEKGVLGHISDFAGKQIAQNGFLSLLDALLLLLSVVIGIYYAYQIGFDTTQKGYIFYPILFGQYIAKRIHNFVFWILSWFGLVTNPTP